MKDFDKIQIAKTRVKAKGYEYIEISNGCIRLSDELNKNEYDDLIDDLMQNGIEKLKNKYSKIIETVKNEAQLMINKMGDVNFSNFSTYIAKKLDRTYGYIYSILKKVTGQSIKEFVNNLKFEKIKEMLLTGDYILKEIAVLLNFGTEQCICKFFKKYANCTSTYFISHNII